LKAIGEDSNYLLTIYRYWILIALKPCLNKVATSFFAKLAQNMLVSKQQMN
jgi:hypothetical protein